MARHTTPDTADYIQIQSEKNISSPNTVVWRCNLNDVFGEMSEFGVRLPTYELTFRC